MADMEKEQLDNDDLMITLELEDGTESECTVLAIFPVDGKQYIALEPVSEQEKGPDEDCDVYFYAYSEDADGQPILDDILDDDVFEAVCDRFEEILDEDEFTELTADGPKFEA